MWILIEVAEWQKKNIAIEFTESGIEKQLKERCHYGGKNYTTTCVYDVISFLQ